MKFSSRKKSQWKYDGTNRSIFSARWTPGGDPGSDGVNANLLLADLGNTLPKAREVGQEIIEKLKQDYAIDAELYTHPSGYEAVQIRFFDNAGNLNNNWPRLKTAVIEFGQEKNFEMLDAFRWLRLRQNPLRTYKDGESTAPEPEKEKPYRLSGGVSYKGIAKPGDDNTPDLPV